MNVCTHPHALFLQAASADVELEGQSGGQGPQDSKTKAATHLSKKLTLTLKEDLTPAAAAAKAESGPSMAAAATQPASAPAAAPPGLPTTAAELVPVRTDVGGGRHVERYGCVHVADGPMHARAVNYGSLCFISAIKVHVPPGEGVSLGGWVGWWCVSSTCWLDG